MHFVKTDSQDDSSPTHTDNDTCPKTPQSKAPKRYRRLTVKVDHDNHTKVFAKIATLNKKMPYGFKAIELSELFCEDSPTFSENNLPTHRQLVLEEKKRKRERETKLDELMRHEPKTSRGFKRVKTDFPTIKDTDEIKMPNPQVFPDCQALLDELMGHNTVQKYLKNEI